MPSTSATIALALTVALPVTLTSCSNGEAPGTGPHHLRGSCMGTTWSATLVSGEIDRSPDEVRDLIQGELDAVDRELSTWKETSDLSRLNAAPPGEFVELGPHALVTLRAAGRLVEMTDGAFDPTVGSLVRLWGFQGSETSPPEPADEDVAAALAAVGWDNIEVGFPGARRLRADVQVDLSAVAKGYAVDLAAGLLSDLGAQNYLMEVGGELVLSGSIREEADGFHIGIDDPMLPTGADPLSPLAHAPRQTVGRVEITNMAVATSGDYRNVRRIGNRVVTHAIDPRTGRPVDHDLASITVFAPSCAEADALATAILVLGPEEGLALLQSGAYPTRGVHAIGLVRTGDPGEPLRLIATEGAPAFEVNPAYPAELRR